VSYGVSTADIESRWRPLSDAEAEVASTLIDDATVLVDTYRPSLAAAVVAGSVAPRIVVMTIVEAVIRVLSNPDILSNQSITADGGVSIGWQFAQKTVRPRMQLSLLDFNAIDQAMAAAGYGTGTTGSVRARNSTPWSRRAAYRRRYLDVDDSEASDLVPNATVSDSVTIVQS
jgi:hypothetical protein